MYWFQEEDLFLTGSKFNSMLQTLEPTVKPYVGNQIHIFPEIPSRALILDCKLPLSQEKFDISFQS